MTSNNGILYIAANSRWQRKVDSYAALIFSGLKLSGITFSEYFVLDNRTRNNAIEYIKNQVSYF